MQDELSAVRSKEDFDIVGGLPKKNIDTGMRPRARRVPAPGRREHVRDRRDVPRDPAGHGADRQALRRGAAGPRGRRPLPGRRRPHPLLDDADQRRCRARQRRSRLRAAPAAAPCGALDAAAGLDDRALPELLPSAGTRWARPTPGCTATGSASPGSRSRRRRRSARPSSPAPRSSTSPLTDARATARRGCPGRRPSLHDTYGFPSTSTLEMASEAGLAVDEDGFRALMAEQREHGQADARAKSGQHADTGSTAASSTSTGPDRVAGLRDARDGVEGAGAARRRRPCRASAPARSASSCSTAPLLRRVRWPGRRRGFVDFEGGRLEVLDVQRPVRGWSSTRSGHRRRAGARRLLHARVDPEWRTGTRQAPPAPTSCTRRCGGARAVGAPVRLRSTARATCGSTSAGRPA